MKSDSIEIWLARTGIFFFASLLIAFVIVMKFLPPMSPTLSIEQVVYVYKSNSLPIRLGCVLLMLFCTFGMTWSAVISSQMKKVKNIPESLAYVFFIGGAWSFSLFIFPALFWGIAAFRPDVYSGETLYLLNDLAWIGVTMPVGSAVIQAYALGIAILKDRREFPLAPRWWGFVNLWIGTFFLPGGLAILFKTGPFAWDGLFVFWIPLVIFGIWILGTGHFVVSCIAKNAKHPVDE